MSVDFRENHPDVNSDIWRITYQVIKLIPPSHAHNSFKFSFILWHLWEILKRPLIVSPFLWKATFLWDIHLLCETADAVCLRKNLIYPFEPAETKITSLPGHQCSGVTITIHPCNKYLTWFLQAFNRENHIWDWEHWVISPRGWWGRRSGALEEFQTIRLFFIFYVKSMYLPVPQHQCCCQKYLRTSLIFRVESYTPPFTVIIDILYTKLPSEKGSWQGSTAMSATSQLLCFSFRNGRFQNPKVGMVCSTSASLYRGWEVGWERSWCLWWLFPLFVLGSQGGSRL